MTPTRAEGVVVDTMVISWLFDDRPNPVADHYRSLIDATPVLLAFQTVMELRHGALRAGWGDFRRRRLERRLAELTVVQPDDEMIYLRAELRQNCRRIGHPLSNKIHDGDQWIAAAAIRLGLPLVSHDGVFNATPRLVLLTAGQTRRWHALLVPARVSSTHCNPDTDDLIRPAHRAVVPQGIG
jgi:predicted nucleic acid-binding protein